MSKYKLSPWHDGSVLPVNVGMYQTLWGSGIGEAKILWRYWNGKKWGWGYENKKWAYSWRNIDGGCQNDRWRGILK